MADAQQIRAVLAKWRAHDWRRAFEVAPDLDGSLRAACDVPDHEPLVNNAGALAMPVLKRLGELELDDLLVALAPLGRADLSAEGPGLAALAGCGLGEATTFPDDLRDAVAGLEAQHPGVLRAAQQLAADVEAGRPVSVADLQLLAGWNDAVAAAGSLLGTGEPVTLGSLRAVLADRALASLTDGSREVLARALAEG
jgi:hypothetical protein